MTVDPNRPLRIDYEAVSFPSASGINTTSGSLHVSWDDLLWAALTIGRPNRACVFAHGQSSLYEAIFRISLLRMSLEQSGPRARRLRRTAAARSLDPSEKGAISYFLGMTMAKLFAARLLDAPWALHVDVFGKSVGALLTQRSRPDLLAQIDGTNEWVSIEAKGRISPPNATAKEKAKEQAERIGVSGATMRHHVGSITYLKNDVLQVYLEDPEPLNPKYQVEYSDRAWAYYYQPALALSKRTDSLSSNWGQGQEVVDLKVEIHPELRDLLLEEQWELARKRCRLMREEFSIDGYQPDGIRVNSGESWLMKFADPAFHGNDV